MPQEAIPQEAILAFMIYGTVFCDGDHVNVVCRSMNRIYWCSIEEWLEGKECAG